MKILVAKLMPIILICFGILLCISTFTYFITVDDGTYKEDDWSNTGFAVSELALSKATLDNIVQSDDGFTINMDLDATVDEIIQTLEQKNGVLDTYISEKNIKEYLKTFIRAELITQYPDLRNANKIGTAVKDNEIQGCIQIHRALSNATNNETQLLTYIDYNTFNSYISSGNEIATNHFSLDANGNLVVAGWARVTTNIESNVPNVENINNKIEYRLIINSIDYKTILKRYTMPFDFLWALTVMGEDEDFAYEVAKLALDSKIIITVQENLTTVTTDIYEEYDIQEKIEKNAWITAIVDDIRYSKRVEKENESDPVNYYIKTNIKDETCITNIDITYADTWLIEYINEYSNVIPSEIKNEDSAEVADTEYELIDSGTLASDSSISSELYDYKVEKCGGLANYLSKLASGDVSGSIGTIYYDKYQRTLNKKTTTTVTTSYNTYTKGTPTVIEKTDKNSTEDNFVTLFTKYHRAKQNILSAPEWLFEMLEGSSKASDLVDIMKYLLYKATDIDYGVTSLDLNIYNMQNFTSIGGALSPFGTNLTKEQFINAVTAYSTASDYVEYMVKYAEDFYDVCTQYNVNPALAFAHACIETGYGSSSGCKNNKNYFGYAHYNTSSSGKSYQTPRQSIEDYCKWIIDNTTPGTSAYVSNLARGKEYATANTKLSGNPETNIYVMYCRYTYLGNTHICDEPNFSNPAGIEYYIANGSNWGTGGRIYTYTMYETGGLYSGEYETRCGHANGSDQTTTAERADYIVYSTNQKINVANTIFGNGSILRNTGSIVESAYQVAEHFLNSGVNVHYAGNSVEEATNNGRICIWNDIQGAWDKPIQNPETYGVVCATYVSLTLWNAGLIEEEIVNQYSYNSCIGLEGMLTTEYSDQWQPITSHSQLQEGDIVFQPGHVLIYVGDGKGIDQNYCVIGSSGGDNRNSLVNVKAGNFRIAYRYIGN